MEIKNLPEKFLPLWKKALPMLQAGRAGDDQHAVNTVERILELEKEKLLDLEVLVPVAMMHDIGHLMILPEHLKYISGSDKIKNGKLVHMLVGAKMANDILNELNYDSLKTKEIVEIISVHDMSQIKDINIGEMYDTENKRIFHDIDALDRFSLERLRIMSEKIPMNNLRDSMEKFLDDFFDPELQKIARKKFEEIKNQL